MTFDVFPRRNLPDGAEPWGRAHDDRVLGLERDVQSLGQSLSGQNRNTASSLASLADQIRTLEGYNPTSSSRTAPSNIFRSTPSAGLQYEILAFDPALDPEISVEATTGRLLITVSAFISVSGTSTYLVMDVDGALVCQINDETLPTSYSTLPTIIRQRGLSNRPTRTVTMGQSNSVGSALTLSRSFEVSVPTGPVNIKLRRAMYVYDGGSGSLSGATFYSEARTITVQQLPPLPEPTE